MNADNHWAAKRATARAVGNPIIHITGTFAYMYMYSKGSTCWAGSLLCLPVPSLYGRDLARVEEPYYT